MNNSNAHYQTAELPPDEARRLAALHALRVLDTPPESLFDDLVALAAHICQVPIALVSLVDRDRQWFKAQCGLNAAQTSRDVSFCAHAILGREIFEIPDAAQDVRFAGNPLVTGEPHIRFYAGAPLIGREEFCYGTLCVIDRQPHRLDERQRDALQRLARQCVAHLETRLERVLAQNSEATLGRLLDTIPDGVVSCDADARLQLFNRMARLWHGTDVRDVPPERWPESFDLFEPDGVTPMTPANLPLLRVLGGEKVRGARLVIRPKGQPPRTVLCNGEQLHDVDGRLTGAVVVMHDVTHLNETYRRLEDERRHLAVVLEGTRAGTWEWNVQSGETRFNERWAEILGYTLAELQPISILTWQQLAHPDDLQQSGELLNAHFSGAAPFYDYICRMRHKDGHWVWVHDRGRVYEWDEVGQPLWMAGTHLDISAEKQHAQAVADARSYLQTLIDASRDVAIIATDTSGVITVFNSGAEQLLGYLAGDVVGRQTPAIFHLAEEVRERGEQLSREVGHVVQGFDVFVETTRSGGTETRQWTYLRKDGGRRQVRLSVSALRDGRGVAFGFLGMAIDITDQLAAEASARIAEDVARLHAERFTGAFVSAAQGMALVSLEGRWLAVNEALCRMLGYDQAELLATDFQSLTYRDDLDADLRLVQELLAGRMTHYQLRKRYFHKSGKLIYALLSVSLVREQNGRPLHFVVQIQDISEQHLAAQKLHESEAQLRDLIASLPGVVLRADASTDWQLSYVSDAVADLCGYPASEFLPPHNRPFASLILAEDLALTYAAVGEEKLAAQGDHYGVSYRICHRDGEVRWVQERGRALRDARGVVSQFIGFIWDVTQQHLADEALAENERFLSALFDYAVDAILVIAPDGELVRANPAAVQLLGLPDPFVSLPLAACLPELTPHLHPDVQPGDDNQRVAQRLEMPVSHPAGQLLLEISLLRVPRAGVPHHVALIRDLTEQKRIERMKSDFVATVSHELRTPLTSIAGALGLLAGGALGVMPAAAQDMLRIAEQNGKRLSQLINDLLDMDKLLAGQMRFVMQDVDLVPLLDQALNANAGYAAPFRVQLLRSEGPPVHVRADPMRLMQVLANLLSNACKHSPPGGVVELRHARVGDQIEISVIDQGAGIPQAFRARIFEKFSQAESGNQRSHSGTGLGLAICKQLVTHMHGEIGFESEEGRGSRFWFRLPLQH